MPNSKLETLTVGIRYLYIYAGTSQMTIHNISLLLNGFSHV